MRSLGSPSSSKRDRVFNDKMSKKTVPLFFFVERDYFVLIILSFVMFSWFSFDEAFFFPPRFGGAVFLPTPRQVPFSFFFFFFFSFSTTNIPFSPPSYKSHARRFPLLSR